MRQTNTSILNIIFIFTFLASYSGTIFSVEATLTISEIAFHGSGDETCNGEDWVELINRNNDGGATTVDLTGYILHDDNGAADGMTFPEGTFLEAGEYLIVCRNQDFSFGIGRNDIVTLLDANGEIVDSVELRGDSPESSLSTYAYFEGDFMYTTVMTPGEDNVFYPALDDDAAVREDFFSLGEGTFTDVIDIAITIAEENMTIIRDHPTWKEWVNFESLSVARSTSADAPFSPDEIVASTGIGRIRTKGQGTLLLVGCQGGKTFPFNIKFDNGPFLGMKNFHLRSNGLDSSYMRDYTANEILRAVGLPHLRSRPARLFLNGEYHGFYSLHEAPDEDYVMQRSFGVSDSEKTGLYKMRDVMAHCTFDTSLFDPNSPVPDPIYAERGRHRDALPQIPEASTREETYMQCQEFFIGQKEKIWWDVGRAYLEYNQSCAVTMVETDMVSRKVGPKSIDNSMIDFLETFYDQENDDLTDFVDIDQWLQSFAILSILVNSDSPLVAINNWYLATTNGGSRDWKIFLYDFDMLLKQDFEAVMNSPECGPLMAYSPIIRGGALNQRPLVRKILNSEDNMEKYLTHVREQVNILTNEKLLDKLYRYGETIAAYASKDEYFSFRAMDPTPFPDITLEVFEKSELAKDTSEYNTHHNPLLPSLRFRLEQVQKQLDAIDSGTLPHNGEYNPSYICLDWRNPGEEKYPYIIADDCASPECTNFLAQLCYSTGCGADGEFLNEFSNGACLQMDEKCNSCFPYSRCGSALEVDESGTFVESDTCGPELAECALVASCFDHLSGQCAFDGEILRTDCLPSLSCAPCFPNSRCGSIDTPEGETEDSSSGSYGTTSSMLVTQILGSLIAGLAWCWMAVIA